tara:strand:- start:525 stop:677 length:153 start_codon:yes stop_codon:yes gene_type:complete
MSLKSASHVLRACAAVGAAFKKLVARKPAAAAAGCVCVAARLLPQLLLRL